MSVTFTGKLGQNLYKAAQDLQKQANGVQLVRQAEELTGTSVMDSEDKTLLAKTKDVLKDVNTKLYGGQPEQDSVELIKNKVNDEPIIKPTEDDNDFWKGYTPGTLYAVFALEHCLATY